MATKTETKNPFEILSKIDVSAYSEKKVYLPTYHGHGL